MGTFVLSWNLCLRTWIVIKKNDLKSLILWVTVKVKTRLHFEFLSIGFQTYDICIFLYRRRIDLVSYLSLPGPSKTNCILIWTSLEVTDVFSRQLGKGPEPSLSDYGYLDGLEYCLLLRWGHCSESFKG